MKIPLVNKKEKPSETKTIDIQRHRAATLAEMGDRLRQARQERSLSLEDIATQTAIPVRLLVAIENGKLDVLPEPVYVRGLIRRFADTLGMEGTVFASEFPTGDDFQPAKLGWRGSPAAQLRPIHLYLLYIVLIAFSVNGLSYTIERPEITERSLSAEQVLPRETVSEKPAPAPAEPASPATVATAQAGEPVRVGLTVSEPSWIRIVVDGQTEFEGTLEKGTHTWEARERLTVVAGNAGGVAIAYNGSQAQPMGQPGEVQEKTFEADETDPSS